MGKKEVFLVLILLLFSMNLAYAFIVPSEELPVAEEVIGEQIEKPTELAITKNINLVWSSVVIIVLLLVVLVFIFLNRKKQEGIRF